MNKLFHGGNLDEAARQFGGDIAKWVDLSSAVSPFSWSVPELPKEIWHHLPDGTLKEQAIAAARQYYGAPEAAACTIGNGSQAFIQNLPFCFKPQTVAIVGFTYQEHGVCWQRAGHDVFVADGLESAEKTARIVVVVNPNNPDGRVLEGGALVALARRLGAKGGLLVVDEAFCDVMPEVSVSAHTGMDGLLVMRSVGKFFGLAGMRLGFAFGAELMIERLEESLGPWPASGPALAIASKAMDDRRFINRTRKKLASGRLALETLLQEHGFAIVGGTDLVVLVQLENATALYEHLARNRILVRPFIGRDDWVRISIPANKRVLNRLSKAFTSFMQ